MTGTAYVVRINGHVLNLPEEGALWWALGLAEGHRQGQWLAAQLDPQAPEATRRVQALQLCHDQQWCQYLYVQRAPARRRPAAGAP